MVLAHDPGARLIWPAAGVALAVVLLWGLSVAPAIFVAAFAASVTMAPVGTSLWLALSHTFEALFGAWLILRWSKGGDPFATPTRVAKFALVCLVPLPMITAALGVVAAAQAGLVAWDQAGTIWTAWWLARATGTLVVAPVLVLWAIGGDHKPAPRETGAVLAAAVVVGLIVFSPLAAHTVLQGVLGFLTLVPLLWAALRCGPRDTATVVVILAGFASAGTLLGAGPFARASLDESFLLLVSFLIGTSVPSLVLSADAAVRRRIEANLTRTRDELDRRVAERTAALTNTTRALQRELTRRQRVEAELTRDAEERRRAQEALASSERQLRLLVQSVTDYAIFMLDQNGRITSWNSGAQRIHGYAASEIVGGHFGCFYTAEDRETGEPDRALMIATDRGRYETEAWRTRKDGSSFYAHVVLQAVRDDNGLLVGFAKITRDVTERRAAQAELEQARDQLAQAQKMEALGQLTGGIAHDFNNLLMIVSGHAQILKRRLSDPAVQKPVEAIQIAAKRGESLTRQLLTFSRRQRLSPVAVDLRERLEAIRAMLKSSLRGNIRLVEDLPEDLWPIEVDVTEFELALVNVAVNARDAMPEGGTFRITARNVACGSAGGVPGVPLRGDFVALALTDTGGGIAPEALSRIFDPFFTTKAVGKGTGLGLSQVHGFAHQSGGTVTAASEPGKGATITVYLPRSRQEAAPVGEAAPPATLARGDGRVLVVEDDMDVAEVTASLIEDLGYGVVRARSGAQALELLAAGQRIDIVFSDVVMPGGMDGMALAQEIRTRFPKVPVLLTSGFSEALHTVDPRFTLLRKPFEVANLERALRSALDQPGAHKADEVTRRQPGQASEASATRDP